MTPTTRLATDVDLEDVARLFLSSPYSTPPAFEGRAPKDVARLLRARRRYEWVVDRARRAVAGRSAKLLATRAFDRFVLVAVMDGRVVGAAQYACPLPGLWTLEIVAVDAAARGKGVGRLLVEDGLARIRRAGGGRLQVTVSVENEAARGLYAGAGFREAHRLLVYERDVEGPP